MGLRCRDNTRGMGCSLVGRLFLDDAEECELFWNGLFERLRHVGMVNNGNNSNSRRDINSNVDIKDMTTRMNQFKTRYLLPPLTSTTSTSLHQEQRAQQLL